MKERSLSRQEAWLKELARAGHGLSLQRMLQCGFFRLVLLPPNAECNYRMDRAGGVEEVPVLVQYSVFLSFQAGLEATFPKVFAGHHGSQLI